jgi:hypothetical protein
LRIQVRTVNYIHGCNYPWSTDGQTIFYGLDFGANIWGSHLGVSTRRAAVAADFAVMASLGFTAARWFVFGDGRAGIVYDDRRLPASLDGHFFTDLDAGLECARDSGIRVVLVLLDHRWLFEGVRDTLADPATGDLLEVRLPDGRARVLHSGAGREALLLQVIAPVVRRYGHHGVRSDLADTVLGYEVINEPDFVIEEWERDLSSHVAAPLPFAKLAELVGDVSELVHQSSPAITTIGCARMHNLWAWDDPGLGLDLLQLHTYPDLRRPQADADVFGMPADALGVQRPVVIGEFPGNGPQSHPAHVQPPPTTLEHYLEFAVHGGYAGAWPWSFSGTDAYGRIPIEPLRQFAARYPWLVNTRAAAASLP